MLFGEVVVNGCFLYDIFQIMFVLNFEFEVVFFMDFDRQYVVIDCFLNGRYMNGMVDDVDSEVIEGVYSKNEDNEDVG